MLLCLCLHHLHSSVSKNQYFLKVWIIGFSSHPVGINYIKVWIPGSRNLCGLLSKSTNHKGCVNIYLQKYFLWISLNEKSWSALNIWKPLTIANVGSCILWPIECHIPFFFKNYMLCIWHGKLMITTRQKQTNTPMGVGS